MSQERNVFLETFGTEMGSTRKAKPDLDQVLRVISQAKTTSHACDAVRDLFLNQPFDSERGLEIATAFNEGFAAGKQENRGIVVKAAKMLLKAAT